MAAQSDTKVLGTRIGTHSGTFHCDEAFATYLLRQTKQFRNAPVVRTRDPAVLSTLPIIVDVGGVYDPATHRYDHHQRGFVETLSEQYKTKLSSAGLIFKHFGREVIENLLEEDGVQCSTHELDIFYKKLYDNFVESLDAIDNGISQYDTDLKPRYNISTDLSTRVGHLNPRWNESDSDIDTRFESAVQLTGTEFKGALSSLSRSWLPARSIVVAAVAARHEVDPSGKLFVLPQACPWKAHLEDLEQEQGIQGEILYALYPDQGGDWRVQAIPVEPDSFQSRLALPEPWRGKRDDELSQLSGIAGCIFVHASGFIGGNKTKDGALEMARKALTFSA